MTTPLQILHKGVKLLDHLGPPVSLNCLPGMAPSLRATDNLYVDFLATIVEDTKGLAALDQVAEMEELISGHDEALKQFTLKTMSTTDSARSNMESIKKKFANERNTWRLLGKLYHDRLTPGGQSEEEGLVTSSICSGFIINFDLFAIFLQFKMFLNLLIFFIIGLDISIFFKESCILFKRGWSLLPLTSYLSFTSYNP